MELKYIVDDKIEIDISTVLSTPYNCLSTLII